MMLNLKNTIKCLLCGKMISNTGSHNADPVKKGRCCGDCNAKHVLPCRLMIATVPIFIKQPTYYIIGEKGNLLFDEEAMINEFKEKLKTLLKNYE